MRRRAYQLTALAASLFLTFGLAAGIFTATRPKPDTYDLVTQASRLEAALRFEAFVNAGPGAFERALENEAEVAAWLKSERLPDLPLPDGESFDYSLLVSKHWEEVQDRQVPVVLFRGRDGGFAKVYAFRATQFNLKNLQGAADSNCQARVFTTDRTGVVYVVVYTGRDLTPFIKGKPGVGPFVARA